MFSCLVPFRLVYDLPSTICGQLKQDHGIMRHLLRCVPVHERGDLSLSYPSYSHFILYL